MFNIIIVKNIKRQKLIDKNNIKRDKIIIYIILFNLYLQLDRRIEKKNTIILLMIIIQT